MTLFQFSYALLWLLAIIIAAVSVILLYLHARFAQAAEATSNGRSPILIGGKLPDFFGTSLITGARAHSSEWRGGRHVLLALSPGCSQCRTLLGQLTSQSGDDLRTAGLVVLCIGPHKDCSRYLMHEPSIPMLQLDYVNGASFMFAGLPVAIVVDEKGIIIDLRRPTSMGDLVSSLTSRPVPLWDGNIKANILESRNV